MKKVLVTAAIAGAAVSACANTGTIPAHHIFAPAPSSKTVGVTAPMTTPPMTSMPATTPMTTPAQPTPSVMPTPECSDLTVSINQGNGAAGTIYYELKFTNVSSAKCYMAGYPGVIAANMTGNLGTGAVRQSATENRVTLNPLSSASAQLAYHDAATTTPGCDIVTASELKVIPPDQRNPLTVPFNGQVCGSATVAIFDIWPVT